MNDVEEPQGRPGKETIHSGHFMVSHFEAEAQDDFDDLVSVPDEEQNTQKVSVVATYSVPTSIKPFTPNDREEYIHHQQLSIEVSLTKLFKCMTLAYRQKLTSPKWNRFKGIKLRWKDKIRLNNVIWRCWHMQFIKKQNTLVCQFASPLDVDTHVKPETTILEGKYWKRRAEAVIAEYKKWRKFHIMRLLGKGDTSVQDAISDMDTVESFSQCSDLASNMLTDEDYLNFMTDTLFSTITNHQPFAFPDCREIARGAGLADFIQPSLGPLQPNLDDFMDTLEPLQDLLLVPRLPPVPEETLPSEDPMYRSGMSVDSYTSQEFITGNQDSSVITMPSRQMSITGTSNSNQMMPISNQTIKHEQLRMYDNGRLFTQADLQSNINSQDMLPVYQAAAGYDQLSAPASDQQQMHVYTTKSSRLQYVSAPKIVTQPEVCYNKYNTAVPPSQTAPETVSLLQQPIQNPKYSSTIVQGRSGFNSREAQRSRHGHYSNQIPNNQYQNYGPPMTQSGSLTSSAYDTRPGPARQSSSQMHYLQQSPVETYKGKSATTPGNNARSFKMPSPPAAAAVTQMNVAGKAGSSNNSSMSGNGLSRGKEQFRSHSLPIGSQLNPDWSVSGPAAVSSAVASASASAGLVPHEASLSKHATRGRESNPGAIRMRSRSTSSGVLFESAPSASSPPSPPGGTARRPPPLNSVASEPTLPQASVMLAHLLSAQHSQSLYKLNTNEEGTAANNEPTISPVRRGQPSPIATEVMSPHHSASPPLSPGSPRAGSPPSPRSPRDSREPRRTHLHAEQKRRYNIKNGFDTLQALIPHLNANPGAKISKAAMLQKGAEYIKQLKVERNQIKEEMENLRHQIECLNNSISNCHSLLPATGAPVSRARAGRLREMFARHVANRTMHNWKYWLFSVVSAALVESFSACVSCGSGADLVRTTLLWAEQHCSLVEMRPAVLNSLRELCTTTDILTNPERLPEEARAAIATSAAVKTEPS